MITINKIQKSGMALSAIFFLALTGCSSSSSDDASLDDGSLSLSITDAPIDGAVNVYVQFSGVKIQTADGTSVDFTFKTAKNIDLLNLQGSDSAPLLEGVTLSAGSYTGIQLMVDTAGQLDSYIVLDDGSSNELTIPSGSETGLKLIQGFDVAVGGSTNFTIDFDLRKSITDAGVTNQYFLKPALRIMDNSQIGHISGNVDVATLCPATDTAYAIYAFEGSDTSPDDTGSATEALTTSLLDNTFNYEVGFLNAGDYTLAVTCIADTDDPTLDDASFGNNLADGFVATANVTVVAKETTVQDF